MSYEKMNKQIIAAVGGEDNIQSVVKTPIEAGIDQLWQYKIHVHPKCKNIWNEFNNYVFDTDNIGNTLNRPKDENNHAMDALRYASEDVGADNFRWATA